MIGFELGSRANSFSPAFGGDVEVGLEKFDFPTGERILVVCLLLDDLRFGETAVVFFGELVGVVNELAGLVGLFVFVPDIEWIVFIQLKRNGVFFGIMRVLLVGKELAGLVVFDDSFFGDVDELVEGEGKGSELEVGETLGHFFLYHFPIFEHSFCDFVFVGERVFYSVEADDAHFEGFGEDLENADLIEVFGEGVVLLIEFGFEPFIKGGRGFGGFELIV